MAWFTFIIFETYPNSSIIIKISMLLTTSGVFLPFQNFTVPSWRSFFHWTLIIVISATNGTSTRQRFHKKKKKKVIGCRANEPTIGSLVRFLSRAPCFFPSHQRLNTHANHWHLFPIISRMYQFGFFLGDCLYRRWFPAVFGKICV